MKKVVIIFFIMFLILTPKTIFALNCSDETSRKTATYMWCSYTQNYDGTRQAHCNSGSTKTFTIGCKMVSGICSQDLSDLGSNWVDACEARPGSSSCFFSKYGSACSGGGGTSTCSTPTCTKPSDCINSTACANLGGTCGCTVASGCSSGTTVTGLCPGGTDCVCIIPTCVSNCDNAGSYCSGQQYSGNCGQTCTGTQPPSCGDTNAYCSGTPYGSLNGCGTCYGTQPGANGISGSCGGSNGGIYVSQPTDLCASGNLVWTDSGGTDGTYGWDCAGTGGTCGGATGSTAYCSATRDFAPTFSSLTLQTYEGNTNVTAENGDRNQICQTVFKNSSNPNGVRFVVSGVDIQGVGDISTIQVRLRGSNTYTFSAVYASNGVAVIPVDLAASGLAGGIYNIDVLINDWHYSLNSGWVDTGRDFKYWDCKVGVSGAFYDGSDGQICPNFSTDLADTSNFKSLLFTSPSSGLSSSMNVNSSNVSYNDGGNKLVWGNGYVASLNSDIGAADISLRLIDLGIGTTRNCSSTLSFNLDNNMVDPYATSPNLRADFSGIIDQEAWFQGINSGILGKSVVTDYVPITCESPTCVPAMSIGGLVAAPVINNTVNMPQSSPNNWFIRSNLVSQVDYYEKYKRLGIGETIDGTLSDLNGKDGLVLVNGDINISQDKTVGVGGFLMLVAKGNININPSVTAVDGILIGNNVNIGGTNSEQLVINGSIYGVNQVNITRGYTNKRLNNTSPAVKVVFRPDFIFKMPKEIINQISNWKWGN